VKVESKTIHIQYLIHFRPIFNHGTELIHGRTEIGSQPTRNSPYSRGTASDRRHQPPSRGNPSPAAGRNMPPGPEALDRRYLQRPYLVGWAHALRACLFRASRAVSKDSATPVWRAKDRTKPCMGPGRVLRAQVSGISRLATMSCQRSLDARRSLQSTRYLIRPPGHAEARGSPACRASTCTGGSSLRARSPLSYGASFPSADPSRPSGSRFTENQKERRAKILCNPI
jgi:hypothetical protein